MTLTTTIEEIKGEKFTVVWHIKPEVIAKDFKPNAVDMPDGNVILLDTFVPIATALRALPRNPTPKDAPLLYAYASHGIEAQYGYIDHTGEDCMLAADNGGYALLDWVLRKQYKVAFEEAIDSEGNRIDVAIEDN